MLESILKGLMQWIYGLFLDVVAYCADALLGVMSTDLSFFEESVPVVVTMYRIFIAIGWGLLIGNFAFQAMKSMFAGLGFETESPMVLLMRTFLFGTLLVFSQDICEIGLSIGSRIIVLLGIPSSVDLEMPDESFFSGGSSWVLVIIVGFILGFQLIKLFFEIAERYVVVAVLTLLCPVGLAMGGSKSTKDICVGYIRTYVSMIAMMVLNVVFLKLILSALSTMPRNVMVLPWCLLVVGIARTARKADSLISKIGLSPAMTGDPLGRGRGMMVAIMAARTIMHSASKAGGSAARGKPSPNGYRSGGNHANNNNNSYVHNGGGNSNHTNQGSSFGGVNNQRAGNQSSTQSQQKNNQRNQSGNIYSSAHSRQKSNVHTGSTGYSGNSVAGNQQVGNTVFGGTDSGTQVNTNRFGEQQTRQTIHSHTGSNHVHAQPGAKSTMNMSGFGSPSRDVHRVNASQPISNSKTMTGIPDLHSANGKLPKGINSISGSSAQKTVKGKPGSSPRSNKPTRPGRNRPQKSSSSIAVQQATRKSTRPPKSPTPKVSKISRNPLPREKKKDNTIGFGSVKGNSDNSPVHSVDIGDTGEEEDHGQ